MNQKIVILKSIYSTKTSKFDLNCNNIIKINNLLRINPIIGCYEEPKPNPLDEMTEEQKEYEAMKLVNVIDKLSR